MTKIDASNMIPSRESTMVKGVTERMFHLETHHSANHRENFALSMKPSFRDGRDKICNVSTTSYSAFDSS